MTGHWSGRPGADQPHCDVTAWQQGMAESRCGRALCAWDRPSSKCLLGSHCPAQSPRSRARKKSLVTLWQADDGPQRCLFPDPWDV